MFFGAILIKKKKTLFSKQSLDLLLALMRTNLQLSHHNSVLGMLWSFIGPASLLAVMYYIFSSRFGTGIAGYPLYLLIGIICVSFFVTSTSYLANIFITKKTFILNTTVPREIIFIADFSSHILKFTVELFICLAISAAWHMLTIRLLWLLVPLYISFLLFIAGTGLFLSCLYVFSRDVQHIWVLASRLAFFATPIFFRLEAIPPAIRKIIYFCNPLTPFLISLRQIVMQPCFDYRIYIHACILGIGIFVISYIVFIVLEHAAMEKA